MYLTHILPILLLEYQNGYAFSLNSTSSNETSSPQGRWNHVSMSLDVTLAETQRTLFDVVWSCIVTAILCAWISVHPDVPPPSRAGGPLTKMLRRTRLMFCAIVAPELVGTWAIRQWLGARAIRDAYNRSHQGRYPSKRWTTAHGYFVLMGAFLLVDEQIKEMKERMEPGPQTSTADQEWYNEYYNDYRLKIEQCKLGPLTPEKFTKLIENYDKDIEIPTITTAQIEDRSKGDGLLKLLAILQALWFIAQCIARGVHGFALTQLELVTLGIVSLNILASAFWWRKPFGVEEPVYVFVPLALASELEQSETIESRRPVVGTFDQNRHRDVGIHRDITIRQVIDGTVEKLTLAIQFIFDPLRYHREKSDRNLSLPSAVGLYIIRLPYRLFFVLTFPIFLIFPFAILFMVWVMETKKPGLQRTGDSTTRLIHFVYELPNKISYPLCQYFGNDDGPLGKICIPEYYRSYQHPSFVLNWFFVIPASFFLLIGFFITLIPLLIVSYTASLVFIATFVLDLSNTVQHGQYTPDFSPLPAKPNRYLGMTAFTLCCTIVGVILCAGWNSVDSDVISWTWRFAALWLIGLSFIPIGLSKVSIFSKRLNMIELISVYLLFLKFLIIFMVFYFLRRQPAAAFYTVDWTKYIPHLRYP